VDFNFWSQTFQMECVAVGIWDMIKPPDGATQAMTAAMNGTVGALSSAEIVANLVKDYFTHIKPPDATYTLTRNIMDGRLESLAEFYQDRMDRLSLNEAALPPLELNKLLIGPEETGRMKDSRSSSLRRTYCIRWRPPSPTTIGSRKRMPLLKQSASRCSKNA
jgi:hypothetical protein